MSPIPPTTAENNCEPQDLTFVSASVGGIGDICASFHVTLGPRLRYLRRDAAA